MSGRRQGESRFEGVSLKEADVTPAQIDRDAGSNETLRGREGGHVHARAGHCPRSYMNSVPVPAVPQNQVSIPPLPARRDSCTSHGDEREQRPRKERFFLSQ